jgi:hypothetical protein
MLRPNPTRMAPDGVPMEPYRAPMEPNRKNRYTIPLHAGKIAGKSVPDASARSPAAGARDRSRPDQRVAAPAEAATSSAAEPVPAVGADLITGGARPAQALNATLLPRFPGFPPPPTAFKERPNARKRNVVPAESKNIKPEGGGALPPCLPHGSDFIYSGPGAPLASQSQWSVFQRR